MDGTLTSLNEAIKAFLVDVYAFALTILKSSATAFSIFPVFKKVGLGYTSSQRFKVR